MVRTENTAKSVDVLVHIILVHIHTNNGSGDNHEICGRTRLFTYTQTMEVMIITTSMVCAFMDKYVNTDFAVFSVLTHI